MVREDLLTFKNVNLRLINVDSNVNNLIKCTIFYDIGRSWEIKT